MNHSCVPRKGHTGGYTRKHLDVVLLRFSTGPVDRHGKSHRVTQMVRKTPREKVMSRTLLKITRDLQPIRLVKVSSHAKLRTGLKTLPLLLVWSSSIRVVHRMSIDTDLVQSLFRRWSEKFRKTATTDIPSGAGHMVTTHAWWDTLQRFVSDRRRDSDGTH